jgi:hypothetical protein
MEKTAWWNFLKIWLIKYLAIDIQWCKFKKIELWENFGVAQAYSLKLYIIWFSSLLILRVPNEGYSRKVSCALNLISMFLLLYQSWLFLLLYQSWLKCMEYVKGNHKECRPNSFICNKVFSFSDANVQEWTERYIM